MWSQKKRSESQLKQAKWLAIFATIMWFFLFYWREELGEGFADWFSHSQTFSSVAYFLLWILSFIALADVARDTYSRSDNGSRPSLTREWLVRLWPVAVLVISLLSFIFVMSWSYWVEPETPSDKNNFVRTYFTILGGLFIGGQLFLAYQNKEANVATVRLSERRHIAELYQGTAEQLGDDKSESQRIAGLYMMERISRDYPEYYQQCIDVICSFMRDVTKRNLPRMQRAFEFGVFVAPSEMRTAVDILSRRKHKYRDGEVTRLNLDWIDFSLITFDNADFEGATFRACTFNNTKFLKSNFGSCDFSGASFSNCESNGTYFNGSQNINLGEKSIKFYDSGFIEQPSMKVRSFVPNHFATLPVFMRPQPRLVPSAMVLAGVGFNSTEETEPFIRDWGLWIRFLAQEHPIDARGWWWEICPICQDKVYEEWDRFRQRMRSELANLSEGEE